VGLKELGHDVGEAVDKGRNSYAWSRDPSTPFNLCLQNLIPYSVITQEQGQRYESRD